MHENAARCSCYGAGLVITVALALSLSIHSTWAMGTFLYSVCFFFFLSGVCVRACPISFVGHLQGVSTRCRGSAYARTDAGYKEERQLGIDRASLSLFLSSCPPLSRPTAAYTKCRLAFRRGRLIAQQDGWSLWCAQQLTPAGPVDSCFDGQKKKSLPFIQPGNSY